MSKKEIYPLTIPIEDQLDNNKAVFVALEGIDASGKTLIAKGTKKILDELGIQTNIFSSFSGPTGYWHTVMETKQRMKTSGSPIDPTIDQTLHTMEYLTRAENVLPEMLQENQVIIADRYAVSRVALCRWETETVGSWPERAVLSAMEAQVLPRPDWTVLLDIDASKARERIVKRGPPFEVKEEEVHLARVRVELLDLFSRSELDCCNEIVDATKSPEELIDMVIRKIVSIRHKINGDVLLKQKYENNICHRE